MKKRIIAGFLLAFMMVLSVVPVFAEPEEEANVEVVAAEEAAAEEAPAEEAAAEEAPAEEAPVEEAPAEEAAPEAKVGDSFTLKEAVYNKEAGTISLTVVNSSKVKQGVPYITLEFDTEKITVASDMQYILDSSIAPQVGIDMGTGVIILLQKYIEAGEEQTIIFDAEIADYTEGQLPEIALSIYAEPNSTVLDLSSAKSGSDLDLTVQKFENILAVGAAGALSAVVPFIKDNWALAAAILIIIILIIIIASKSRKTRPAEAAEPVAETEYTAADEDGFETEVQPDAEDEENGGSDNEEI